MEPEYLRIAAEMYGCESEDLPKSLREALDKIDTLARKAKAANGSHRCGGLLSRQVIAMVIAGFAWTDVG